MRPPLFFASLSTLPAPPVFRGQSPRIPFSPQHPQKPQRRWECEIRTHAWRYQKPLPYLLANPQCLRRELNPHDSRQRNLNPPCLPISPRRPGNRGPTGPPRVDLCGSWREKHPPPNQGCCRKRTGVSEFAVLRKNLSTKHPSPPAGRCFWGSPPKKVGGWIRTNIIRVMSPTACQLAYPDHPQTDSNRSFRLERATSCL